MTEQIFILQPSDADLIANFERARAPKHEDPLEQEMATWHAKWRPESLQFYLPLGWSFGLKVGVEFSGYFLGQPLLFYRGLTQTLWIEHMASSSDAVALKLIETAYKWSRDKHLQAVVFAEGANLPSYPKLMTTQDQLAELKSARF